MDVIDKDFIQALLDRKYTLSDVSNLLQRKYPNVKGFSLRSVQRFCQDNNLSSRKITNFGLNNVVAEAIEKV